MKVLIGDAYGADKAIQQELYKKYDYPFVTVYASNGKARNNVGDRKVKAVDVRRAFTAERTTNKKI